MKINRKARTVYREIIVLSIVYHGLGGVVSSFQDSGIIILRVIDTAPPEAWTSIELKKTSNRTLNMCQNHRGEEESRLLISINYVIIE